MSDKPPPFAGYTPVSGREQWAKILSGEIQAHVYSSEARGDFEPVPISAAAFFMAEEAGRDEEGEPDPALKPYQVMVRDDDRRRPSGTRRRIRVPHWVYVAQKTPQAPQQTKQRPKPRRQTKRERPGMAVTALWPHGVPDQAVLSNDRLCKEIADWLKADCAAQGVPVAIPSADTLLRAAGRK